MTFADEIFNCMTEIKRSRENYVRIDGKEPAFTKRDDKKLKKLYKHMEKCVDYFDKY